MNEEDVISIITKMLLAEGGKAQIHLLKVYKGNKTFQAEYTSTGINVNNLGNQSLLPWSVFTETFKLLKNNGGRAIKGNAMQYKLGQEGLPLDSVEGNIAVRIYDKKIGENIFRRITPVVCILIWANICQNKPGELVLRGFQN